MKHFIVGEHCHQIQYQVFKQVYEVCKSLVS